MAGQTPLAEAFDCYGDGDDDVCRDRKCGSGMDCKTIRRTIELRRGGALMSPLLPAAKTSFDFFEFRADRSLAGDIRFGFCSKKIEKIAFLTAHPHG